MKFGVILRHALALFTVRGMRRRVEPGLRLSFQGDGTAHKS